PSPTSGRRRPGWPWPMWSGSWSLASHRGRSPSGRSPIEAEGPMVAPHSPRTAAQLRRELARIDRQRDPAYHTIAGAYDFGTFNLVTDHVQGDPFAAPSRMRILRDSATMGLPAWATSTRARRIATADWIARRMAGALAGHRPPSRRGSGTSGLIAIDTPGQEIL